jgi:hypothetical protein
MQTKILCFSAAALMFFNVVAGQESQKNDIKISTVPSDPIPTGTCDSSMAGYLEKDGRTKLTDAEIGHAVSEATSKGYVVTIYPEVKRGTFVTYECPARSDKN